MAKHKETAELKSNTLDKGMQMLVVLFCLAFFPIFIIYSSLAHLYELKVGILRAETHRKLTQTLEIFDNYGSNRKYFHHLFKKISLLAQNQKDPKAFLQKNFSNLKKNYPGSLEFITWDKDGKIVPTLTDQQGYKFILTKLFETLQEASNAFEEDMSVAISDLPVLKKNKNLVGKFVGRFFIPDHLRFPYLSGQDAGSAIVDFSSKRSEYWFQIGKKISFFVFFNNRIMDKSNGLSKLINTWNKSNNEQLVGYVQAPQITELLAPVSEDLKPDLMLALARYENFSQPVIETEHTVVAINVTGDNLRTFSIIRKPALIWSVEDRRNASMARIIAIIILLYLFIYFLFYKMQIFVSIRLKLTMVFLFANLIPLVVLGFIGYDYLESKAISLKNEFISNSFEQLKSFDAQSERLKEDLKDMLQNSCRKINILSAGNKLSEEMIRELKNSVLLSKPSEGYLVSSESEKVFECFKDNKIPTHSNNYVIPMLTAGLKYLNGEPVQAETSDFFKALLSPAHSELIRNARKNSGKIIELNTGNSVKIAYEYALGLPDQTKYNYLLFILWDFANLNQQYADKYFSQKASNISGSSAFLRSANGSRFWPQKELCPLEIRAFLEKVESSSRSIYQKIYLDNKPHIAVGMKGMLLSTLVMANVIPEAILTQKIFSLRIYILVAIILNILLTIAISLFLSHQFMKPIRELEMATLAIGRQDFRHRIPQLDNDELGYLGATFNRVTEGLGDLDVARIVQESLFPGNHFSAGNFKIFGRSIVMTTLGGDYYDCFEIDPGRWALVIGDVAGHGVPAGLMMAMAKAGVLMSSEQQQKDPSELIKSLHQIFFSIKNPNMKRMMTFQYFLLEHETGNLTFANAGHCFPIIIDPIENSGTFIEHVATPLGIGARSRCKNYSFELKPGQALILYTDGIAEARNKEGEEFGFERLRATLPGLFDPDPEVYYKKILALYNGWSNQPDDDLTIIVAIRGMS